MEPEQVESGLPLDPNPYPAGSDVWRAYNQCLELERKQWTTSPEDLKAKPDPIMELGPRVVPRVLGRALCYAPCDQGRDALACEILDCKRDDELLTGLAHLYLYGLARVCAYSTRISPTVAASGSDSPLVCKPKSPTPSVSAGPSPGPSSSFGTAVEELEHLLRKSSIHVRELRKLLMHRDNNRCVFTGALDMNSVSEEMIDNASDPQLRIASLDVAHVISQSLSEGIDQPHSERAQIKFKWAKTVGAIIECFGGFSSHEILGAHVLNSPRNVFMTSSGTLHDMFDCFHIWLTPARDEQDSDDEIPDTYDVNHYRDNRYLPLVSIKGGNQPRIQFRSVQVGQQTILHPHPHIIALHAACARIAHMCGAMEHLKKYFQDAENISVMT